MIILKLKEDETKQEKGVVFSRYKSNLLVHRSLYLRQRVIANFPLLGGKIKFWQMHLIQPFETNQFDLNNLKLIPKEKVYVIKSM